jgi:hypothetical protein
MDEMMSLLRDPGQPQYVAPVSVANVGIYRMFRTGACGSGMNLMINGTWDAFSHAGRD